ncbi:lysine-specific demethylase 5B-like isoform X2 [Polypterus senegalus]|uniref:lysine-specific demethylase 5B-like isoform X2 n=1 Tax=Polypterus senegalus TaxID=55291 RepID=UPI001966A949|nr:lysine-specific demethylase 5B-like isoform X2 [Polypterus senegalus]
MSQARPRPRPDEFIPPPECPVFEPSWEEFADPFAFINKIRPIAEKTGICKIRPPPDWQPPFACDVDKLHFTPRIQRLNELEAQTRVKLNFLDQIAKFWELQGCTLKIPHVERKILDLYHLNKLVVEEGGFDAVCKDRKWTKIALKMGFAPGKAVGSHIRAHYERILYPYNLFQSGASLLAPEPPTKLMSLGAEKTLDKCVQKPTLTNDVKDKEYKPHDIAQRQSVQLSDSTTPARRAKRMRAEAGCVKVEPGEVCDYRPNLRRRMGSVVTKNEFEKDYFPLVKQEPIETAVDQYEKPKARHKKPPPAVDLYVCLVCGSGSDEDRLLLCDGCDDSYHTFCLIPPLHDVPKGDWRCPKCLAQECSKPQEAFGFEQAYRDYTLRAFGEMADAFKSDYFNMPVHMVPTELVEKEFWRLVSTIEEDVTVEYGADIASKEFGSGFPVRGGRFKLAPEEENYLDCGWNLNNMPVMDPSVLTHITADICGMKLPWLYVGMCFSSFCWHIEDHWSYSINYLHWGEPKTWYGAPGYAAEQLEDVMKKLAPELFESQPDLLHQLVTIMNPNTLMAHGVPIYRTNQCAGEFVITFPRAYHSGFNQGFNFAEAVNFCTMDWVPLGRQCVDHYRLLHRYCVFSHDEMICRMASKAESLDVVLASTIQKDMAIMIAEEKVLRDKVRKMGIIHSDTEEFDLLPDDERQCARCRTTCFLSAITCPCSPGVLVCLFHAEDLCPCPVKNYTLKYSYTLDDLYPMMNALKQRAESYDEWASNVTEILEAKLDQKRSLEEFQSLMKESERRNFPDNDLLRHLHLVTQDAEKCSTVAQQLLNGKRQTRYRAGGGKSQNQLTVEELRAFIKQLYTLPCSISQTSLLKDLLSRIEDFQQRSEKILLEEVPCVSEVQELLEVSVDFDVDLPQLPMLRERLEQGRWLQEVQQASAEPSVLTLDDMRRLIDLGVGLSAHPSVEKAMARLQELLTISELWEDKAKSLLKSRTHHAVETLAAAVEEVDNIPAYLPNCLLLKESVQKAKQWLQEVEALQLGGRVAVLDTLTDLVTRGRLIPVQLDPLARLESLVSEVQAWKECAAKTFLGKNSPFTLLEVLCPRCEFGVVGLKRKPKKAKDAPPCGKKKVTKLESVGDVERALSESKDSASAMATLGEVRLKELEILNALRAFNEAKLLPSTDNASIKVCLCQKPPSGSMFQCELCRDLFHSGCVTVPNSVVQQGSQAWLCPLCHHSEKPPLEKILPLLASLQRIRVRLPEGDALRYMIERTVSWQHRFQQVFSSRNLPSLHERAGPSPSHHQGALTPSENNGKANPTGSLTQESVKTSELPAAYCIEQKSISLQGLSSDLEELMVEALLLQVSLPEIHELYQILQTGLTSPCLSEHTSEALHNCDRPGSRSPNSQGRSPSRNELGSCNLKKDPLNSADRKQKRRLDKDGFIIEKKERLKKPFMPQKKKMKLQKETLRDVSKPAGEPRQQTDSPTMLSDLSYSDDSEEDIAICPAEECQQPEGEELSEIQEVPLMQGSSELEETSLQVDWVQCDGSCNQWFHQVCVGVSAERAEKEDYICINCTVREGQGRK